MYKNNNRLSGLLWPVDSINTAKAYTSANNKT